MAPKISIDRWVARKLPIAQTVDAKIAIGDYLKLAAKQSARFDEEAPWASYDDIELVVTAVRTISSAVKQAGFSTTTDGKLLAEALELAAAFVAGLLTDILLGQRTIQQMDGEDFRDWLVRHGAAGSLVQGSPLVKALYDTMFQYPGGKIVKASYGAGTATQVLLRMLATYRGSAAWELQAGSGEVIIAPLFDVLRKRGVKFQFFHKLSAIQLSSDRASVASVLFDRQVYLKDPDAEYEPIQTRCGLRGFGSTPDWSLIKDGSELERDGVDLSRSGVIRRSKRFRSSAFAISMR